MSRHRRSRTSRHSSPPSSPIASAAAPPAPLKLVDPVVASIRYAETDQDVTAIHRFLLVVAQPAMRCPVDVLKSLHEVIRVARDEAAIMLMRGDTMIGTMGLMRPTWWYGNGDFLTDRWHFCLPGIMNTPEAGLLLAEARAIAGIAGLEFIHQGKIREPKNGVSLMMPRAYSPESAVG